MIIKIEGKQGCGTTFVAALIGKMLKNANWTSDLNGEKIVIRDGSGVSRDAVDTVVSPSVPWVPQVGDIVRRKTGTQLLQSNSETEYPFRTADGGTFNKDTAVGCLELVNRPASLPAAPAAPRYVLRWRSDGEYLTSMPNASEARWGERKEALEMTKGAAVEKLSLWGNQSVALVRVRGT